MLYKRSDPVTAQRSADKDQRNRFVDGCAARHAACLGTALDEIQALVAPAVQAGIWNQNIGPQTA
jgi:hypothetical protein